MFMWSPLSSILVSILDKSYRFAQLMRTSSRHLEVTKNTYYVLPPDGSQKKVSAHGLLGIFPAEPLSEILAIANLRHAASRI